MIPGIVAGQMLTASGGSVTPPAVGAYWTGQGGYYAGMITYADARQFRIIVADVATTTSRQWKVVNTNTAGTDSNDDGFACTAAMIADSPANHPAADYCNNLVSDSMSDWYMPSKTEIELLRANLRTGAPGVHPNFALGGPQAFTSESSYYHSSSQASAFGVQYNWASRHSTNTTATNGKNDTRPIRPIRRVAV